MKYLIIDKYKGRYIKPKDLCLSLLITEKLKNWLLKYENEYYEGFKNDKLIDILDKEGTEITALIKNELSKIKIEYFSNARMKII